MDGNEMTTAELAHMWGLATMMIIQIVLLASRLDGYVESRVGE
jgi:hypothetical protein